MNPLDIVTCKCATCRRSILSRVMQEGEELDAACKKLWGETPPFVAGRIKDRPYCPDCLALNPPPQHAEHLTPRQRIGYSKTSA